VKSLIALLAVVIAECGDVCGVCTTRDVKTVTRRVEDEGYAFLALTLPNFGKDFERSLDEGKVTPERFAGFHRLTAESPPQFLRGFLEQVFDMKDGWLLDTPSIEAIRAIRQITLMFGKIDLPIKPERERKALDEYVQCESEVRRYVLANSMEANDANRVAYRRVAGLLWSGLLCAVDARIHREGIKPHHSNGATADGTSGNLKYNHQKWTSRLEKVFPHWEMLIPSESFLSEMDEVIFAEPDTEMPVKVITVPKTLKTPRIIAMEPVHMQYVQQGILSAMREEIACDDNARSFVMFDSQLPNQLLAQEGSSSGELATLDLSEASDRVNIVHVEDLLQRHTLTREAVFASRSLKARVPGHGVIPLSKFASMGSALTFPIESLVFMTVIFVGIEKALNRPLTSRDIKSLRGKVRTYGDDIIVPTRYTPAVMEALALYGFKVNQKKSFWTGKFRESCGSEWYDGHEVNLVRIRRPMPKSRRDVQEIVSTVALRNNFYKLGLWRSAGHLDMLLRGIGIPLPNIEETSSLLGRLSVFPNEEVRWCPDRHIPLVRGMVVQPIIPRDHLEGYGALMKWFLHATRSNDLYALVDDSNVAPTASKPLDRDHLERFGRPISVRIKSKWRPAW
jgi:hypothetical protein